MLHILLFTTYKITIIVALVIMVLLILITVFLERPKSTEEKTIYDEWHKDPKNWKAGIFYFNKNDPRLFPPKKFKALGFTINYENPKSYLVFLAFIVIFILLFVKSI